MNRTKIEWTDFTWSPITGCSRRCEYCYAERMAKRLAGRYGYPQYDPFAVTWHLDRLHEPSQRKKPAKIFTCSMGELFDPESHSIWVNRIFAEMWKNPHHTFQVLTKQPQNVLDWGCEIPHNCWFGISQDGRYTRLDDIDFLRRIDAKVKFISFEPLLRPILPDLEGIDWIIIGARTGSKPFVPSKEWVDTLTEIARAANVPVFLKDNLMRSEQIREWPKVK